MKVFDNSFPKELDGAKVLYYTDKGNFEWKTDAPVTYLAICVYPNSLEYYLFLCDEAYEVVNDYDCDSAEECKRLAATAYPRVKWNES